LHLDCSARLIAKFPKSDKIVEISRETSDFANEVEMIAEKVNINDFSME
jgi:hypothetical protein